MCGRFSISHPLKEFVQYLRDNIEIDYPQFSIRYNIAPGVEVPVLVRNGEKQVIRPMKWGQVLNGKLVINARSESVHEKVSFRSQFTQRRCLILANNFFEWPQTSGPRQPYCFQLNSTPYMFFAGIFNQNSEALILTTEASPGMSTIHHRMPLILNKKWQYQWIAPIAHEHQKMRAYAEELRQNIDQHLSFFPVSRALNKATSEGPELLQQVELESIKESASPQLKLFDEGQ